MGDGWDGEGINGGGWDGEDIIGGWCEEGEVNNKGGGCAGGGLDVLVWVLGCGMTVGVFWVCCPIE